MEFNFVELIPTIISGMLMILSAVLGSKFAIIKNKLATFAELANEIEMSLADNTLTAEEAKKIMKILNKLLGRHVTIPSVEPTNGTVTSPTS